MRNENHKEQQKNKRRKQNLNKNPIAWLLLEVYDKSHAG